MIGNIVLDDLICGLYIFFFVVDPAICDRLLTTTVIFGPVLITHPSLCLFIPKYSKLSAVVDC